MVGRQVFSKCGVVQCCGTPASIDMCPETETSFTLLRRVRVNHPTAIDSSHLVYLVVGR